MKKWLYTFLIGVFLCIPFFGFSTHIVGGSLTYIYNGGSSYTVTLKLYRDCASGTAAFPGNVTITVLGYDSATFSPSRDFTMSLGTVTPVPSNLDSCAAPPNPMPCVEQGIYTTTVNNLPPNPGGYHMYYQLIARNLSLTNVNAACNCIGESFYAYIPGQSVYWIEKFKLPNGTTIDNGSTAWSRSAGTPSANSAMVNNELFEIEGADDGVETWTSQVINIASYPLGANVSMDLSETGTLDPNDSIFVYYRLNGGPLTLFTTNGFLADDFTSAVASQTGLIGNTIQIVIRVHYDGISPASEIYQIDNVLVYGNDFIPNDDPVFTLFPPLFLCVGTPFTFDHSATDADGDSLVYSFYTPYDGDNAAGGPKDPSFLGGNTAIFKPVIWRAGYSATSPLGGSPLTLNDTSGLLKGTPGMLGQFVVGVKVKEYRNGVYIGETLRDFQFNVVNCAPPAQAILSPFTTCSGNAVNFTSQDTSGARYWWNFGNLSSTSDTSILKFPSYTYPGPGTYTVTLITNKGTPCADTATALVNISWVAANFAQNSPTCVGSPVTFTDNSTKSANSTLAAWSWNFGDAGTSSIQSPSHTYLTSGTYTVTLTATSNLGCTGTVTKAVTINPKPIANAGVNISVCANNPIVSLNGSVTNATGGTWSSNGTGTFNPDNTTLNATYTASNADTAAGLIRFVLTTTGNGVCSAVTDTVFVTITDAPTTANAGPDQTVCGVTSATLSGNVPLVGTGTWTLVSGAATITNPNSPNTTVTGLAPGSSYTFRWTISAASCISSSNDVIINVDLLPTTANAGANQTLCNSTTATLSGNTPTVGTGAWTVVSGTATVTTPSSPNSGVTGLVPGDSVILRWTITQGLCSNSSTVKIVIQPPLTVSNAGPPQTLCGVTSATLGANTPVVGTGLWSVVSGTATITSPNSPNTTVTGLAGGMTYTFRWTISGGVCAPSANDVVITIDPSPTIANAGADQTLCGITSSTILANTPTVGTGSWTLVSGGGTISNPNSPSTTVTGLTPGAANTFRWTVTNSSCPPSTDDVVIYVNIPPTPANAGPDQTVCGLTIATLMANTPLVGTGVWTIVSGTATITNPGSETTTVTGLTAGSIYTFRWTIDATCPASIDDVVIKVDVLPTTAAAGTDQYLCNVTTASVSANAPVIGTGVWTVVYGTATITSPSSPFTVITGLSPGDSVILRWTITKGFCSNSDDVTIVINPITTIVNAGADQLVCSNSPALLTGVVSGVTITGSWGTTGTGIFSPNSTTLNASYTISAADVAAGTVKLILTTTNNGACTALKDTVELTIRVPAIVNAGIDQVVCANNSSVALSGKVNGITSTGTWSANGDGIFSSTTNLSSIYTPGNNDKLNGAVKIVLTSTNNSPCPAVTDTILVNISPAPTVSAGPDQTICSNTAAQLNGSVLAGSVTGQWSTTGTGTFSPAPSALNAIYTPDSNDIAAGQVRLVLVSTNNGNCLPVYDTLLIAITKSPSVNAGIDQFVCSTASGIVLNGSVSGGTSTGLWSTTGGGSFSPNTSSLITSYNIVASDTSEHPVYFILTSTNNGVCPAVSDTFELNIVKKFTTALTQDTFLCSLNSSIRIMGLITGEPSTLTWISSGTGTFSPDNKTNPVNYVPSAADIAGGQVSIKCVASNSAACSNDSSTMILHFYPSPTALFTPSKRHCYIPNDPVTFTNNSTSAHSYSWTFGDGGSDTIVSPVHNYPVTGTYKVTLTARNNYGCVDSVSDEIIVSGDVIFPTGFTPDKNGPNGGTYNINDLTNNVFFPFSAGIVDFHMMIFNRWGELIFETFDVKIGWDGYYRGKLCQQDTYVWKAEATFNDGRSFGKKGSVTLIR